MHGMVNAHTHVYSALAAFGLPAPAEPKTFVELLKSFWWRLDRSIDQEMLRASARYYVADALLHGTRAVVDHHESPCLVDGSLDIIADACQELGMRALVCYGATERNDGSVEARRGLDECRRFIRANTRPLVRGVVGLHASFTVSDDTIRAAGELCRETATVLHVHIAEDACDVEDARRRGYDGVVDRLVRLDALPEGSILAHGVHLTVDEVRQLESLGCWLVQNPRSNEQNKVGYAVALGASRLVALGTDGFASDMLEEARIGESLAAEHRESPGAVNRRLAAGQSLMARWFPGEDAAGTAVRDGRLMTGDWDKIRNEAARQARRLADRMRALG